MRPREPVLTPRRMLFTAEYLYYSGAYERADWLIKRVILEVVKEPIQNV